MAITKPAKQIQDLFPFFTREVDESLFNGGEERVFTDNTASTQVPQQVLDKFLEAARTYANIHRGKYAESALTTEDFERAYNVAANLVNAGSWREIVFGRNTTEMINLVAKGLETTVRDGDNIVVTGLEHNANYVSWLSLARHLGKFNRNVEVRIVPFSHKTGEINMSALARMIDDKTKIVSVTGASNFMGIKPKIKRIGEIAHSTEYCHPDGSKGSLFMVDGAQLVPASPVDVQDIDCDFLAWSFHKMTLPLGVGALYGKSRVLEQLEPMISGGDMVQEVKPGAFKYRELPWKFTAGTPNVLGVIATGFGIPVLANMALGNCQERAGEDMVEFLGRQIKTEILLNTPRGDFEIKYTVPPQHKALFGEYLQRHPEVASALRNPEQRKIKANQIVLNAMSCIQAHEEDLTQALIDGIGRVPNITIYGTKDAHKRAGLVAFNIDGMHCDTVAIELDKRGVPARSGVHCASLAHHFMDIEGSARTSFYLYNTREDAEKVAGAIKEVATLD